MALFVSAETTFLARNVRAAATPFLNLSPTSGAVNLEVKFYGNLSLVFPQNDTSCTVSSLSSGVVVLPSCLLYSANIPGFGSHHFFNGSFAVGNVPTGQYIIQVTGSPNGDYVQAIFTVTGTTAPRITLTPGTGPTGTHVVVGGTNFSLIDRSCLITVGSGSSASVIQSGTAGCEVTSGTVIGSFIVGSVSPGQYVIQVNAYQSNDTTGNIHNFAQSIFTVTSGPFIQLSTGSPSGFVRVGQVASGPTGTHVSVEGSGFVSTDTTCSIAGQTLSSSVTGYACSVFSVTSGPFNGFTNVTASFIVGYVPPGQYVIRVTGSPGGDFAEAIFSVTSGPTIFLSPATARPGAHILANGTGFLPTDTTCSLSSPSSPTPILSGTASCVIRSGSGIVNASFTIGNVLPGQYIIQVTGSPGSDFAQAILNVVSGPAIFLSPASARTGAHILVNGTGFLPTDTTCSLSSPSSPTPILSGTASCVIRAGSGLANASFTVANVLPGQYIIQVTGNGGDSAQAILNVVGGPAIFLSPATGRPGTHVLVNGTGFLPTDTTCSLSSPSSSNPILSGTASCVVRSGSGIVNASFTIGNVLPGQYIIQVTGSGGDSAQAILNVVSGPAIYLSPATGHIGDHISVNGTGFLPTDTSCTLVSGSSNAFNPILQGSQACVIRVGTGLVNASFILANVPPGQYVIQVNGNQGDSAQAILTVASGPALLTLSSMNATNGATVTFRGYGLSVSDTGCMIQVFIIGPAPFYDIPNNNLITSPTCSIVSPQTAQGSFVVGPYATTNFQYNITVRGTPGNDIVPGRDLVYPYLHTAFFNVTASISVTPPSGTRNTVFTFTGSGFSSTATSCQAHIYPPFPTVPPTLPPACYLTTSLGQVGGSVIVPSVAVPGTYAINVGDNRGHNATGFFTVGTPSALIVLNPATAGQSQPVGVAGVGFNPNNTFCVITAGSGTWILGNPTCSVSGGYVSGTFTVSSNAIGGYYLITVTAWPNSAKNNFTGGGDFASNFLGVSLSSTVTTFFPTTTTVTNTISLPTTTTSVATSYTYYSTTYSTTGLSITSYTHLTVNTVSGLTTTIITQTSSTTQTQTTVTVTTTTQFTTVSCGALPCPYALGSQAMNSGPFADEFGLLAVLLLIVPMLLRKLFQ